MNSIALSVVIPCYNAERNLEVLLNQLDKQNLDRELYEIILVDDGSQDRTFQIASHFIRIKILQQERGKPQGPGEARNRGMVEAKGRTILFLDSDLEIHPDLLLKHYEFHEKDTTFDAAGGSVAPLLGYKYFSWSTADHFSTWFMAHPGLKYVSPPGHLPSLNFSIKRRVIEEGKMRWNSGLEFTGEDVAFCDLMRKRGMEIRFLNDALVYHRDREALGDYLRHQYRYGFHGPFVRRGQSIPVSGLKTFKFGFLFPTNPVLYLITAPLIVMGGTWLIWSEFVKFKPLLITTSIPQLMLGRVAYAWGAVMGTLKYNSLEVRSSDYKSEIH